MTEAVKPKRKPLGCARMILVAFTVFCILPSTYELLREKWEISSALANAKTIRLEHFRNSFETGKFDGKDEVIATKELAPADFSRVGAAFPLSLDFGAPVETLGCLFNPHHRIIITDAAGNVTTIKVCFECDHLDIAHGDEKYRHIVRTPFVWMWSLRRFFEQEGMPNSPDLYRAQWSKKPANVAPATNAPPTAAPK